MTTTFLIVLAIILLALFFIIRMLVSSDEEQSNKSLDALPFYLLAENRDDEALEEFKKVALSGKGSLEVYFTLGALYKYKCNYDKAIHIFEGMLVRSDLPKEVLPFIYRELIDAYLLTNQLEKAEQNLNNMPVSNNSPEVTLLKARLLTQKLDYEGSVAAFTKYAKLTGKTMNNEICYAYIKAADMSKNPADKIKLLKLATKTMPNNRLACIRLFDAFFSNDQKEQGIDMIKFVINKDMIKSVSDVKAIENDFYKYKSVEELADLMSARITAETSHPAPYLFVANFQKKKNNIKKATDILEQYLQNFPVKSVVLRQYLRLKNDFMLNRIAVVGKDYKCNSCGYLFDDYDEICPNCDSLDTLDYN